MLLHFPINIQPSVYLFYHYQSRCICDTAQQLSQLIIQWFPSLIYDALYIVYSIGLIIIFNAVQITTTKWHKVYVAISLYIYMYMYLLLHAIICQYFYIYFVYSKYQIYNCLLVNYRPSKSCFLNFLLAFSIFLNIFYAIMCNANFYKF